MNPAAPIGKKQLAHLAYIGGAHLFQVVGCAQSRGLARRGLMRAFGEDGDSFYSITPAGLRALADAIETGKVKQQAPEKQKT